MSGAGPSAPPPAAPASVIPSLVALAGKGVLYPEMRNQGRLDHVAATGQILNGRAYPAGQKIGERLPHPTIFEYYRKATQAPAHRCLVLDPSWHPVPLDHSAAQGYGAAFGGIVLRTRRAGVAQMLTVQMGKNPKDQAYRDAEALKQALLDEDFERAANQEAGAPMDPLPAEVAAFRTDCFQREQVPQKFGRLRLDCGDALTLFMAHQALKSRALDPAILCVNLHGPDVAHRGSYVGYVDAVRKLDGLVGEFVDILDKEKLLATTAVVITPDVGRDLETSGGGWSAHRSGDLGCRRVFALILAPGAKAKLVDQRIVDQADLCPTIGEWLGVPTPEVGEGRKPLTEVV